LGFSIDEKTVRRTGLDYWKDVDLKVWENIDEFHTANPDARLWYLSTKANQGIWDVEFEAQDFLLFGRESKGLPESWIFGSPESAIKIPMEEGSTRSLNLATSVAIVLYEAQRQIAAK
ncbi:tRNA (cytidine(34)-2'-O)-methyltransferase, partial [Akkermansiaceae bacterium]|nr:tRNA (cytidine(34)-2'-O)-methyltransferase [Akkermansiaceae bacterium]